MSNFVCKECGAHHLDLGKSGYKTHDDVELLEDYHRLSNTMIQEGEKHIEECLMCENFDFHKKIDELKNLLQECYEFIKNDIENAYTHDLLTKIKTAIGESEEQ